MEYAKDRETKLAMADTIIIAVGSKPESELFESTKGTVPEMHQVSDCVSARTIKEAIEEAARIARSI